ncbi:hypothetical protein F3Y22_tig00111338pilonHSYRG00409 [Hibiscus syriacus]|uniref:Uncharacterized protein n=1 Tax=Hibiscus syriacus TaxID=106335 RepID=A0A6A2YPJ9_HIBSY|nr:hypothetical protein F3Y22_tig00111338pilonHSYRG00409 [Hibiscus syriacus]
MRGRICWFISRQVATQLGNFLGAFIDYDISIKYLGYRDSLRIREEEELVFQWDLSLRAPARRRWMGTGPWLRDDDTTNDHKEDFSKTGTSSNLGSNLKGWSMKAWTTKVNSSKRVKDVVITQVEEENSIEKGENAKRDKTTVFKMEKVRKSCGFMNGIEVESQGKWRIVFRLEIYVNATLRGGLIRGKRQMTAFRDTTDECALSDVGYNGVWYTWEKGRSVANDIRKRLYRAGDHFFQYRRSWHFHFEAARLLEDSCEEEVKHPREALARDYFNTLFSTYAKPMDGRILEGHLEMELVNHMYIVLTSKVENPRMLSHFWPISLCNVIFKIVSKMHVLRMQCSLSLCIDETQSAFVSGQVRNFDKLGVFFSTNVTDANRCDVHRILEVSDFSNLEKYLGLPTIAGRNKWVAFAHLRDRFHSRIRGWSVRLLSQGGKKVFIKTIKGAFTGVPGRFLVNTKNMPVFPCAPNNNSRTKSPTRLWHFILASNEALRWVTVPPLGQSVRVVDADSLDIPDSNSLTTVNGVYGSVKDTSGGTKTESNACDVGQKRDSSLVASSLSLPFAYFSVGFYASLALFSSLGSEVSHLKSNLRMNIAGGHGILRREVEIVDGPFVVKLSLELDILRREIEIQFKDECHDIFHREVEIVDDPFVGKLSLELDILHLEIVDGPFVVKLSLELDILHRKVEIQSNDEWHDILRRELKSNLRMDVTGGHDILRREVEIVDDLFVVKLSLELDIIHREVEIQSKDECCWWTRYPSS